MGLTPRQDEGWSYQEAWRPNKAPTIERVLVTGSEQVGGVLTATIDGFADYEGNPQGICTYQWYRAYDADGAGITLITDAINSTYVVTLTEEDMWIMCRVVPVAVGGTTTGTAVDSSWKGGIQGLITGNEAPTFTSTTVAGTYQALDTLTATGNGYADNEGDAQDTTTYEWWRADDASGTNDVFITGATSSTYVLQYYDVGYFISCKATPTAQTGSSPGNPVQSTRVECFNPIEFVSDQTMNIGEDFVDTDTVGYVTLNRDYADGNESFELVGGDTTVFAVSSSTGEITVIDDTQLDNGTDPVMSLDVYVYLPGHATLLITVTINVYAAADTFYVDSSVSSSGDGSKASPWKMRSDITGIAAGDLVLFKRGETWEEDGRYWTTSGTAIDHIVFSAYGSGERPILTVVSSHNSETWVNSDTNIWRCTSEVYPPKRLILDGTEVLVAVSYSELGTDIGDIATFFVGDDGGGGNYLYIYSTDTPLNHTIEYSEGSDDRKTVLWNYADYIDYENIEFVGGFNSQVDFRESDYCSITNCKIGAMAAGDGGLRFYDYNATTNNYVADNNIIDSEYTLDYSGSDSSDARAGGDGLRLRGSKDGVIKNNYFKNWGHASISLAGSTGIISGNKIFNNTMTSPDIAYGGRISIEESSQDNEIYNNLIDNISVRNQLSGIRNHFHHNIIKNVTSSPIHAYQTGQGIFLQGEGTYNYDNIIENNLFIDTEGEGIGISSYNFSSEVTGNIFRNNICYNCGTGTSDIGINIPDYGPDFSNDGNTFQNNLVYSSATTDTVSYYGTAYTVTEFNSFNGDSHNHVITNNIADDPLFINPTSDWHLTSSSPAINAGTAALSTEDYEGNTLSLTTPDIGIYETV